MSGPDAESRPAAVYWILGAGLISFSFSPILVRFASDAPGLAIAVWRTLIAAAVLAPIALPRIGPEVRAFTRRDWMLVIVSGVLLGLHFVSWIESLYRTSVASASVLVTTSPIFLAVLGYLFLREHISKAVSIAIGLGVLGAALIGWGDASADVPASSAPILGNSLALTAALVFSFYLIVGRIVRRKTSWLAYVFPLYTTVAVTILLTALVFETPLLGYSWAFYGLCALMALGPQILGHGSFNYAVRYFPVAVLGVLSLSEPVGASLLAYFLFGEVPEPVALIGMVVVLGSISFAIIYRSRRGERREAGEVQLPLPRTD